jgi:hypothetical protein
MERGLLPKSEEPPPVQRKTKRILVTSLFAGSWIVLVASGLGRLLAYEHTAGSSGVVAQSWPGLTIKRATNRPTLVMIAHPRCPCTDSSVAELAQIMAEVNGKVAAYVLFFTPKDAGSEWEDTELKRSAAAIPGVTVVSDIDGIEAQRFGAETSGHTLLFGTDGRLLFSGGITASRGHAGDNTGEDSIVALLNNRTPARNETLVFGCSLADRPRTATAEAIQ